MSAQEDPRGQVEPEVAVHPPVRPVTDLQGEALRRAWLDAGYRVRPEPPNADILADWGHEDCAICAKAAVEPTRGMNIPALLLSVSFGILLWGLIGYVAWLTWQAVA